MIGEASCSKTPAPLRSSTDPTQLAPGFRFHPTDEELLSYYLKRKVTGRPILVDAIAEVNIYGAEPWDLPQLSRLRSRDLEWYFFTSLGRKYSNRCRTNRATIEGYWKTTGKDRPIQSRSRTIGMKKTLVYHVGRAPRGKRTNWVMHEYRLQGDDISRSGIQQDAYVVCKVFEKTGAGPQNGAQYGAPFVEEEWDRVEDDDANVVLVTEARDDVLMDPAIRGFVQLDDFLLDQESSVQHADSISHSARSVGEDYNSHTEDPSDFLVDSLKEQASDGDMPPGADSPTMQYNKNSSNRLGKQKVVQYQTNPTSIQNNGYMQLKDIFGEENTNSILNIESADCFLEEFSDNSLADEVDNSEILPQDAAFINQANQLSVFHDIQNDDFLQMDNLDNMQGQSTDVNLVYYDTISHDVPCLGDGLTNETSMTPMAEFDFLDELIAYYDATDDNLNYPPASSFQPRLESIASSKVVASSSSSKELHVLQNLKESESLRRAPSNDDSSSGWNDNLIADDPKLKDCQNKTLTKRLANLLDAISAPPAFADESAVTGKIMGKASSSSTDTVHVTAGMIRIQQSLESWKLQNHSGMDFLLSYGVSKSISHERRKKIQGGFISSLCWAGFHLFLLCSCVLALNCKFGALCFQPVSRRG
ncbi:NAC domain-containing protein 53-like [Phalaenopsis equestris]|uniref:NAC domain-containing protein 53-like n=1 Tax=Phalaenopsis equestris TaxID=78828 RepID=UPI0009E4B579|nr:NAC domain-containing protein 53-like [Phalaenopsis equestris]